MSKRQPNSCSTKLIKVVLLGDECTGKTALLNEIKGNKFNPIYEATVGLEFESKIYPSKDKKIKLHFWDTAGLGSFRSVIPSFVRGAHFVIICFDLKHGNPLKNILRYNILRYIEISRDKAPNAQIMIVGTKSDQYGSMKKREFKKELEQLYKEVDRISGNSANPSKSRGLKASLKKILNEDNIYMTSAKEGKGIKELEGALTRSEHSVFQKHASNTEREEKRSRYLSSKSMIISAGSIALVADITFSILAIIGADSHNIQYALIYRYLAIGLTVSMLFAAIALYCLRETLGMIESHEDESLLISGMSERT